MKKKRYYVAKFPTGFTLYEREDEALSGDDLGNFAFIDLTDEEWKQYQAAASAFFPWHDRMAEAWHASPRVVKSLGAV